MWTRCTVRWADARARMQALTDAYVGSFDDRERATLRRRITALIHEEMPVIPVSWFEHTVAVNRRVTGITIDPFEMRYMLHRVALAS